MIGSNPKEKELHLFFEIGVILKGLNALLEIVGGLAILFINQTSIIKIVFFLTQEELSEDPKDVIANYLVHTAKQFSISTQHFLVLYLLIHGLIKGLLIYGLLKKKIWSYPVSIIVFGIFIIYQLARYYYTSSLWLIVLSIFDLIVVFLIWHEYQQIKNYASNK